MGLLGVDEFENRNISKEQDKEESNQEDSRKRLTLRLDFLRSKLVGKHGTGRKYHKQEVWEKEMLA